MTTTAPVVAAATDRPATRLEVALVPAACLGAIGLAAGNRILALLGLGVLMLVLAAYRLEYFVLVVLVIRSALDHLRGGSSASPATLLGAGLIVLVVGVEVLEHRGGLAPRRLRAPFRLPLVLLVGAAALSTLAAGDVKASGVETLRLAGVLAMVLALERVMTSEAVARRVLVAVLLSSVVPVAFGLLQVVRRSGRSIGGFSRVIGTFLHPNPFSIYLALIMVMAIALIPHVERRLQVALGLGLAGAGACLVMTYTRASWIAFVVGVVVVGLLQSRRLVLFVCVAAVAVFVAVPSVSQRLSDLRAPVKYSGATSNSLVWRVGYWQDAITLARDSPVIGIGLKGISESEYDAKNAHNDLVRMYVETGLVGFAAYLLLACSLFVTARRAVRTRLTGWQRGVAVGFAGSVATLAVVSLTSNVITQVVLLWYVAALGMVTVAVTAIGAAQHKRSTVADPAGAVISEGWMK